MHDARCGILSLLEKKTTLLADLFVIKTCKLALPSGLRYGIDVL
jgi:hypothetical protein